MGSWIREHFVTQVIPMLELRRTWTPSPQEPVTEDVNLLWRDKSPAGPRADHVTYCPSPIKPCEGASFRELRLLKAYVKEFNLEPLHTYDLNSHGGTDPPRGWKRLRESFRSVADYARKKRRRLLLAGRDAWTYEVLARRYGVASIFIPVISRQVARDTRAMQMLCHQHNIDGTEILLDTGFVGSIPEAFSSILKKDLTYFLLSQQRNFFAGRRKHVNGYASDTPNQVFPNMKESRGLALWVEYTPKYYKSGTMVDSGAIQYLSEMSELVEAAIFTSVVWRRGQLSWDQARQVVWELFKKKQPKPSLFPSNKVYFDSDPTLAVTTLSYNFVVDATTTIGD